MLHPTGMALFGEFQITNNYDLSLQLESLVKSLGIGLEDDFALLETARYFTVSKAFSSTIDTPTDYLKYSFIKTLDNQVEPEDSYIQQFTKLLNQNTINYDGDVDSNNVTLISSSTVKNTGKSLSTIYTGMSDAISSKVVAKSLETTASIDETVNLSEDWNIFTNPEMSDINETLNLSEEWNIQSTLDNGVLTVSGQGTSIDEMVMNDEIYQKEIRRSTFTRSWQLPDRADLSLTEDDIIAELTNGILSIVVTDYFIETPRQFKKKEIKIK
jgi:hypothetical protein